MTEPSARFGKVYLIGAGPGHPGLISRYGFECLQRCDAVLYDDLIPIELVVGLPERIEKHYVGKRAGKKYKPQSDTDLLVADLAKKGLNVARLKGGDSIIFARVAEEADFLRSQGIECVLVPGITAASAAVAEAGFSLTDRRAASWVVMATGHEAGSASPPVPWEQLAALGGGTIVVYMGMNNLHNIVNSLQAGGMRADASVVVVQNASTGVQRFLKTTLENLEERCRKENFKTPALVILGEVSRYSVYSDRLEKMPLAGKRILVTRPAQQVENICRMFREQGAEPIPYPTIKLGEFDDCDGWNKFCEVYHNGGWCVFTSEAGVRFFFSNLRSKGLDLRVLGRFRIAAVGYGTSAALAEYGLKPDLVPAQARVKTLVEALLHQEDIGKGCVVRVRGNLSDTTVEKMSGNVGAEVLPLTVYSNTTASWDESWISKITDDPPDYLTFTSASTFEGFHSILGSRVSAMVISASRIAAIGPSTMKAIENTGYKVAVEAEINSVEGLVAAIVKDSRN